MRHRADRPVLNTVFVFGAGASFDASKALDISAPHTAPLDKQFCARIKSQATSKVCPGWVRESAEAILTSWRDAKPFDECGLEEAVLLQVAHLNFLNAVQPARLPARRRKTRFALRNEADFVYHLAHVVAYVLRQCREKPSSPFGSFAHKFFPGINANRVKNRAITFNYDTLFDRHLLRRFGSRKVYFENIGDRGGLRDDNPLLLKLHGSVNWFIMETEYDGAFSRANTAERPYCMEEVGLITGKSPAPDEERTPLIIPPVPNKPITTISLFTSLWTRASEYLEGARHIVICGYSLPETDTLAKTLLEVVPVV